MAMRRPVGQAVQRGAAACPPLPTVGVVAGRRLPAVVVVAVEGGAHGAAHIQHQSQVEALARKVGGLHAWWGGGVRRAGASRLEACE
jgi:hypothetical protein